MPTTGKRNTTSDQRSLDEGDLLDWKTSTVAEWLAYSHPTTRNARRPTEDNDIQNQHNQTNNPTTSSILPRVTTLDMDRVNRRGERKRREPAQLGEEGREECVGDHIFCVAVNVMSIEWSFLVRSAVDR